MSDGQDPYLAELDRLIRKHRGACVEGLRMAREAYLARPVAGTSAGACSTGPGIWQEHEWTIDGYCARCGVARNDPG